MHGIREKEKIILSNDIVTLLLENSYLKCVPSNPWEGGCLLRVSQHWGERLHLSNEPVTVGDLAPVARSSVVHRHAMKRTVNKNSSQDKLRRAILYVECQFCLLVLWKRPLSAPSLTPSYSNNTCVNCPAYMTSRAIPNYWENSWCTACTLCCLVSMHQIHCLKAYFIPNVLREYFELNTLSIHCTHFSLDFTLAQS